MGAWGEKGYDNDSGEEWLDGLAPILRFTLDHAFWSRWTEEGIAACQLLTELPPHLQSRLGVYCFNEALEVVEGELDPKKLEPWKFPEKRKLYLEKLQSQLLSRRKVLAKEEEKHKARMKKLIIRRGKVNLPGKKPQSKPKGK